MTGDPVRAVLVGALAAVVVFCLLERRRRRSAQPARPEKARKDRLLSPWRSAAAAIWFLLVLGGAIATHVDSDLRPCTDSTQTTSPAHSTEDSSTASGAAAGKKVTTTGQSVQTTRSCDPLGVGQLAVLMVPAVVLVAPALKGFNVAGLFGVDFKEQAAAVAKEQVFRVILETAVGATTLEAVEEARAGRVSDLPAE